MKKIGLIGVGLVGTAVTECLLSKQFRIIGYDLDPARLDHLNELGGETADSPAAVARQVKFVMLSLPESSVVREVIHGAGGILQADRLPRYIIDTTTGDPEETIALAEQLAGKGIHYLDATISGSSQQIRRREGVFMVGGEREAFEACKNIFQVLTEKIFYLGSSGSGAKAKLASNLILGLNRLALAEGLVFAETLGLNLHSFLEMLKQSPAYSVAMDVKGRKMLQGDFSPESRIKQHHKDVALILKYAEKNKQSLPLSAVHYDILEKAIHTGRGEMDTSAVIAEIRRRTIARLSKQTNGKKS